MKTATALAKPAAKPHPKTATSLPPIAAAPQHTDAEQSPAMTEAEARQRIKDLEQSVFFYRFMLTQVACEMATENDDHPPGVRLAAALAVAVHGAGEEITGGYQPLVPVLRAMALGSACAFEDVPETADATISAHEAAWAFSWMSNRKPDAVSRWAEIQASAAAKPSAA